DKSPLAPGVPAALGGSFAAETVKLPLSAYAPDHRNFVCDEDLRTAAAAMEKARTGLRFAPAWPVPVPHLLPLLDLSLANAKLAALRDVISAERLEDAGKKDSPEWKKAATDALTAQRARAKRQAARDLFVAEQARRAAKNPAQVADAEAKLKTARTTLTKAAADLKAPLSTAITPRSAKSYPVTNGRRRLPCARSPPHRQTPLPRTPA